MGSFSVGVSSIESSGITKELSINHHNQLNVCTALLQLDEEYGGVFFKGVSPIESPGVIKEGLSINYQLLT